MPKVDMNCPKCKVEMNATPSIPRFPDCNTWTCSKCGHVEPELGSFKVSDFDKSERWLKNEHDDFQQAFQEERQMDRFEKADFVKMQYSGVSTVTPKWSMLQSLARGNFMSLSGTYGKGTQKLEYCCLDLKL